MKPFDYEAIISLIPKLNEKEYLKYVNIILNDILNTSIINGFDVESIRVPMIGKYLQFLPFSYQDYLDFTSNMGDIKDTKKTVFVYVDIDITLQFRDFLKEYARVDTGIDTLFEPEFLLQPQDSSIYNYISLKDNKFSSLIIVKEHLKNRIADRYKRYVKESKGSRIKNMSITPYFMMAKGEFALNKNLLKLVLKVSFD